MRSTIISGVSLKFQDKPERVRDYIRNEFRVYRFTLVALDLLLILLAFRLSYFIRFDAGIPIFAGSIIPQVNFYVDVMLLAIPIWIVIYAAMGLYQTQNLLGGTREYSLIFNATALGMLFIISAGFLFPEGLILARGWVLLAWVLAFLMVSSGRFAARRVVYSMRQDGHFQNPALIVGVNEEGRMLVEQFQNWRTAGVRIVGYINDTADFGMASHIPWLGTLADLDRAIEKYSISDVILTNSALSQGMILALFRKYGTAKDIDLRMSSGLYEIITTGMQVKEDGLVPLLTINKVRMTGLDYILKTMLDYCIAIPMTLVGLPFLGLIALAVRLDSPGQIIYRRRVMGVNGREFDAFKFRTMHTNSDEFFLSNPELMAEYQENFKLKNDPRITHLGKFLRKTSLDELPQLFNVLLNQMSVVGPRMICPDELSKYNQWDINLLTVKPGITGMWQVQGRSNVSYEERVRMDMFYIRNWTIWLDLQILISTIPAVIARRGAF